MAKTVPQLIQEHAVWAELNSLDRALAEAEPLLEGADPEALSAHASLLGLAKHTHGVLNSINPILVPKSLLDPVNSSISAITSAVTVANGANDAAQLVEAWDRSGPLLSSVSALPVVKTRHDVKGVIAAIDQFHQRHGELLDDVDARVDTLREVIEEMNQHRTDITADITAQKDALATAISEFQEQIAAEQTEQEAAYTAAFAAAQAKLDAAIEKGEEIYAADEEQRQEQIERFDTEFQTLKSGIDDAAKTATETTAAQAETVLVELHQRLDKANELVGMIGDDAMRGHYGRNANEQKTEADKWRVWTVRASIAAVVSAAVLLLYGLSNRADRDWVDYASRFGVTIALVALATYLGAQARIHRQLESKYRSLELELATLDPFLSTMNDKERHNIKTQLASKYFVGADPEAAPLEILKEEPA